MKLALIPPLSLLDYTSRTDFQLMLPHLTMYKQYEYTYKTHCKDPEQYVILDNGVAEGLTPVPEQLFGLADEYGVDEIVMPDKLGDARRTKTLSEDFIDLIRKYYRGRRLLRPKFMFVLQGQTLAELDKLMLWAAMRSEINVIGLPRILLDTFDFNMRYELAHRYSRYEKPFHLLGANAQVPTEIGAVGRKWPELVRSHDTSSPFNYAYAGKTLRIGNEYKRPPDYFLRSEFEFDSELTDKNIDKLMKWCGYDL